MRGRNVVWSGSGGLIQYAAQTAPNATYGPWHTFLHYVIV